MDVFGGHGCGHNPDSDLLRQFTGNALLEQTSNELLPHNGVGDIVARHFSGSIQSYTRVLMSESSLNAGNNVP